MDFYVALQCATQKRGDVTLIHPEEVIGISGRNPSRQASVETKGNVVG
ncbi:hypothetical protein [uncultured Bradyrhizobium sp.]